MQHVWPLQNGADRAHQRHLEAVEHPGDAEADDQQPMKFAPWQTVQPRRNQRLEGILDFGPGCQAMSCAKRMMKVEPLLFSLRTSSSAPLSSRYFLTSESPRPTPSNRRVRPGFSCEKASKTCGR